MSQHMKIGFYFLVFFNYATGNTTHVIMPGGLDEKLYMILSKMILCHEKAFRVIGISEWS